MPEDQFQLLIRKTIQYNKRVKLDEKDSTGLFSKQEQETVLFSVHRGKGLEMVPLSELLENMNLKEKTDKEEEKAKEKGAMKSEDIDSFADSATINSPISYRNILDQEIPDFRDQSPLLLPRSLLRSPPAYTSSLVTPPLPPVGPRLLSGSNLLQAARSFDPILSAPQRGANYDTFRRTNFARKADIEIEQEPGYEKGRGRNDEKADEMEHGSNDLRTNLGATSRDVAPLTPSLSGAKQKPRLHLDLHLPDLPVLNRR